MNRFPPFGFVWSALMLAAFSGMAPAQTPPPQNQSAAAMTRTEHVWKDAGRSSTFDALWTDRELKMIREELAVGTDVIEKNEYIFNAGALLHFKQDRYPAPGKSGPTLATMVSFDKTGKAVISMKRLDGKPVGPATAAEIDQVKKHLDALLAIADKRRP